MPLQKMNGLRRKNVAMKTNGGISHGDEANSAANAATGKLIHPVQIIHQLHKSRI